MNIADLAAELRKLYILYRESPAYSGDLPEKLRQELKALVPFSPFLTAHFAGAAPVELYVNINSGREYHTVEAAQLFIYASSLTFSALQNLADIGNFIIRLEDGTTPVIVNLVGKINASRVIPAQLRLAQRATFTFMPKT